MITRIHKEIHKEYTYWLLDNQRHRKDGPAIEYADGHKEWYFNGEFQRSK